MKDVMKEKRGQDGVTLLEVIITLVVGAVFSIMVIQYMGSSLLRSTDPLIMAQDSASLTAVMEKVTADYKKLHAEDNENVLTNLKARIESGTYNTNECTVENAYVKFVYDAVEEKYNELPDTVDGQILKVTAKRTSASDIPLRVISLFTRMY